MKDETVQKNLSKKMEEYIEVYSKAYPAGGCVLAAKDGEVLFKRAYGMANLEHDISNSTDTKFLIGSITKTFTAAAIMMMYERGLINLNDSIRKYLPDYPEVGDSITIHHLLTHSSGIPAYTSDPDFLGKTERLKLSHNDIIGLFKDKSLEFEPGEKGNYCNSGYHLLGVIIEKITGESYEEFLNKNIFKPLGMNNSGLYHQSMILKNRASGYEVYGDKYVNGDFVEMATPFSAGAIYSTVDDMLKFDNALHSGKIVSRESMNTMFKQYSIIDEKDPYGYGVFVNEKNKRTRIGHPGGLHGYLSLMYHYVEDNVFIIALCNTIQDCDRINDDIAAIIFGEEYELITRPEPVKVEKEILEQYAGKYGDEGLTISVKNDGDVVLFRFNDDPWFEVLPISNTLFNHKLINEQYEFVQVNNETGLKIWGMTFDRID